MTSVKVGSGVATPVGVSLGVAPGSAAVQGSYSPSQDTIHEHSVTTTYQQGSQVVYSLSPDSYVSDTSLVKPIIYFLPVEAGARTGYTFGDPMALALSNDWHNTYECHFMMPTTFESPWFGTHVSSSNVNQHDYLNTDVRALIHGDSPLFTHAETQYDLCLISFSKGGFSCASQLLYSGGTDRWGYVGYWDGTQTEAFVNPGLGSDQCFGTFAQGGDAQMALWAPVNLVESPPSVLTTETRIVHVEEHVNNFWPTQMSDFETDMNNNSVLFDLPTAIDAAHTFNASWLPTVIQAVLDLRAA